ncbi:AAC(3) family N-acetyltransferase [Paenibacillus sp. LHD-117]|uniref:aminoglycoside N(3)-acetyltransferase n=1 Tax=Paenibacillus sp. LHD-117 TaxID=3071412 RepID=UPI0027E139AB|nr:AAC(3) family N-acetyltransferase [Paenibacillus sp. LHD-117]MDQ6419733.1 AAC(3) family N-acetyltransferase [Paenibacillus sp. LHD-117]
MSINTNEMPLTAAVIAKQLTIIGIEKGMTVLLHSSLKSMNRWIVGGETAVIMGLEEALGADGTLVMPTHTSDLSEPSLWQHPPVPESWWPVIREEMPPFMPDLTPTSGMGAIPECFRKQSGALRSNHPQLSFAARGKHANWITANHSLEHGLGEASPLARLYELDGWVLLLGVGHNRNTSLHLSEHRANYASKEIGQQGAPILVDGDRQWIMYDEVGYDSGDFYSIGETFEKELDAVKHGKLGDADIRLMPVRELVDYGVKWMERNRS